MILYFLYIIRVFSESIPYMSGFVGVVIILLFFILLPTKRIKFLHKKNDKFVHFFLVYTIVSLIGVGVAYTIFGDVLFFKGMYFVFKPFSIIALFLIVNSQVLIKHKNVTKLLHLLTVIYFLIAVYSVIVVFVGNQNRAYWPTVHPNSLGTMFVLFASYVLYSHQYSKVHKVLLFLSFLLGLMSTKSLSSIFLLILVISIFLYSDSKKMQSIIISIFIIIFFVSIGSFFLQERINNLEIDLSKVEYVLNSENTSNSFEWRLLNWKVLFIKFLDRPIFGWGTLSWEIVNPIRTKPGYFGGYNSHSELFGWLVQFGLVGTLLLSFTAFGLIFNSLRNLQKSNYLKLFHTLVIAILLTGFLGKTLLVMQYFYILILIYSEGIHLERGKNE